MSCDTSRVEAKPNTNRGRSGVRELELPFWF